jgi:hypothetical protein
VHLPFSLRREVDYAWHHHCTVVLYNPRVTNKQIAVKNKFALNYVEGYMSEF